MPVYEYRCGACLHKFEKVWADSRKANDDIVQCPECKKIGYCYKIRNAK